MDSQFVEAKFFPERFFEAGTLNSRGVRRVSAVWSWKIVMRGRTDGIWLRCRRRGMLLRFGLGAMVMDDGLRLEWRTWFFVDWKGRAWHGNFREVG